MKLKDRLHARNQILDALASKDKMELKKASYVAYDDIIEFPKPVAFTIKALKKIIKQVENTKLKEDSLMVGVMLEIPVPDELKKFEGKRKVVKTKSKIKKYNKLK